MRMAVAAAVIGIAVLGWWLYPTGKVIPATETVEVKPQVKHALPKTIDTVIVPAPQNVQQNTAAINGNKAQDKSVKQPAIVPAQQNPQQNTAAIKKAQDKTIQPLKVNDQVQQAPVAQPGNDKIAYTPQPQLQTRVDTSVTHLPVALNQDKNTIAANDNIQPAINNPATGNQEIKQDPQNIRAVYASNTVNVPYKVIDTDDEDRSMYIGSLELNKDKVKGFFKRAGRIFGGGKGKKEMN